MTVWIPSFAAASNVRAAWSSSPSMTGAWPEGAVTPDAANAAANSSARSTNAYGSTCV
ncbi:hypothetical protein CMMCAS04_08530 [Clavibacter michiganensis subsp. michiganensis]|nr:hypothetical protein CMMCAS04_08530 [Clavibacter michiganensis subsp. michiganensis]